MSGVGPKLEIQGAIIAKLKASAAVKALIGDPIRLYMDPPTDGEWTLAYVTIGDGQNVPDQVQCLNAAEIFVDLHVWSRAAGFEECDKIATAIYDQLNDAELTLASHRCVEIEHNGTRSLRDPDGKTKHAVVGFKADTEPP